MRFTRRRKITNTQYQLGDDCLSSVSEYPYFSLTLSNDMSWQKHIDTVTCKANKILGLLHRNLWSCSQKIKGKASLASSHLI